ncbi:hypothetical protein [Streptomyces sp. NPDC002078]
MFERDLAGGDGPTAAHDLHGLSDVREVEAARDGAGLDPADLVAAVRGGVGSALQRDLPPRQPLQLLLQGGVVALDHGNVVGLLVLDEEASMLSLRVQRVEGDHGVGEVQRREQRFEEGDFVGAFWAAGAVDGLAVNASVRSGRWHGTRPGGLGSYSRSASQRPTVASRASPSTRCSRRRTVASAGATDLVGSRTGPPNEVSTAGGASVAFARRISPPHLLSPCGGPVRMGPGP